MRRHAILLCALLVAATDSLRAQEPPTCSATLPDSLTRVEPPVYSGCQVTRPAERRGGHPQLEIPSPGYQEVMKAGCLRAELGFVVDARGRLEEGSAVLLETNQAEFGAAVLAASRRLRFNPARLNDQPVRQWVIYRMEGRLPDRVPFVIGRVTAEPVPSARPLPPPPSNRPVTTGLQEC